MRPRSQHHCLNAAGLVRLMARGGGWYGNAVAGALVALSVFGGCTAPAPAAPEVLCSVYPIKLIADAIVGGELKTRSLLRPSDSPHTYTPTPADAVAAQHALALLYVSPELDGWIAQIESPHKIAVLDLLPESQRLTMPEDVLMSDGADAHGHGHVDPHFWPDPMAVAAVVPGIVAQLGALAPERRAELEANGAALVERLNALDAELKKQFSSFVEKKVAVFHPSWLYFTRRYGLEVSAILEPSPGKELSPKSMEAIIQRLKGTETLVVVTEPQVPRGPAQAVADAAGIPLVEIDPLGGTLGISTYEELIRENAAILVRALS